MATPVIEVLLGIANGANTLFFTSRWYVAGSTQLWVDGQIVVSAHVDGWKEEGQDRIRLKLAPEVGQIPQMFYMAI